MFKHESGVEAESIWGPGCVQGLFLNYISDQGAWFILSYYVEYINVCIIVIGFILFLILFVTQSHLLR